MFTERFLIRKKLALIAGGLALFGLIVASPPLAGLTADAQKMAAVALLMGILWIGEAIPIPATALIPLVLYPLLGILPSKDVAPHYANHLVFLFLGGFMIALAMERWNLHKRIALVIIRAIGGSPSRIVLGFMVATAFLSMWISNTATTMMMLPVGMAVVRQIAAQTRSTNGDEADTATIEKRFGLVLMLGLAYAASIGGVGTLIGTPPNIVFAGFYKTSFPDHPDITFTDWMGYALPVVFVFLPLVWFLLCRFAAGCSIFDLKVGDGAKGVIDRELAALGTMSRAEKFVGGVFVVTAFLWIFRKPIPIGDLRIPGWSEGFPWASYLHDATVAVVMGLILLIVPVGYPNGMMREQRREFFVLDWNTVQQGVPWGILLLFGGGFALAAGFRETGLDVWIGEHIAAGGSVMPLWALILVLCLGITFLTEFSSNTATATMILPVIAGAAAGMPYPPLLLMIPVTLSASFAFMMPVATPPNAIVFGSGWVTIPQMAKVGFFFNLIGAALVTLVMLFVVQALVP
ncbi:SLC13 family permease [Nitrospina watsonii]|uniref:Sodium-dependent dicarboxylate transporter SdcS n=1 Tax=Nitrospina watsonii TaxID=1323948 RepID=A0ABM9HCP2_9BACT|nr:SLC13 family permease [Nitrospina watsonii]CAI2717957.1 Sodium-dependent dicarboxylate transporter SdcS [Nitrospina watsonii]